MKLWIRQRVRGQLFFIASVILLFLGGGGSSVAQIPLTLKTVPDGSGGHRQQLWIYLGINNHTSGGVPVVRPYLFDTGSAMFNAAYYNGAGENPNKWIPDATLLPNTTYSYGAGVDTLNVVTVSSIQVYQNATSTSAIYSFSPTAINPTSSGYVMGQVTDTTMALNPSYPSFKDALEANASPYVSGVFGTFGAGMFTGKVGPEGNKVVVGSILGQSTTEGWAIVANTPSTSHPFVILGLDETTRSQFSSSVKWESTGQQLDRFPNSNAISGEEFDTVFNFSVVNGQEDVPWTTATLLDTGTADTNIYDTTAHGELHTAGLLSSGSVLNGSTFSATGTSLLNSNQPTSFTTDSNLQVDGFTVPTRNVFSFNQNGASNQPVTTVGINFFLNNSVAFDLENRETLYTSQVVPEPTSLALGILAGGFLILALRGRGNKSHPDRI